jgi:hypothetical protein
VAVGGIALDPEVVGQAEILSSARAPSRSTSQNIFLKLGLPISESDNRRVLAFIALSPILKSIGVNSDTEFHFAPCRTRTHDLRT